MPSCSLSHSLPLALALLVAGCKNPPNVPMDGAPCPDTQAIVEATAMDYSELVRLTVHSVPPQGGACCAIASTSADKLGQPSDPEDLEAMETGEVVVLEEPSAIDVTVPVMQKNGSYTAAVGVTLRNDGMSDRDALIAEAKTIATAVAVSMAEKKG